MCGLLQFLNSIAFKYSGIEQFSLNMIETSNIRRNIFGLPFWVVLMTIFNTLPVLCIRYFTTEDGGPHSYNAGILLEKIFHPESPLSEIFSINTTSLTNWTSHLLLALFRVGLPPWLADKALQILFVVSFPLSFYWMLKSFKKEINNYWVLIFPFAYTMNFYCGFYNFCLGLVLMFFAIGYCMRMDTENNSGYIFLALLLFSIAITHLYVFATTLIFIALIPFAVFASENGVKSQKTLWFGLRTALAALPGLIVFSIYFLAEKDPSVPIEKPVYLGGSELLVWLSNIRPLVVYGFHLEPIYTRWIFYLLLIGVALAIFSTITNRINNSSAKSDKLILLFGMAAAVMLILLFKMPDSDGRGGFISLRFATLFFIMLFAALSFVKIPKVVSLLAIIVVLIISSCINWQHYQIQQRLSFMASNIIKASYHMESYSIMAAFDYSDLWMVSHYSSYAAANRKIIMMDNYEADVGYFPLKWNRSNIPAGYKHLPSPMIPMVERGTKDSSEAGVDYIMIYGHGNTALTEQVTKLKQELKANSYKLTYYNDDVELYGR